MTYLIHDGLDLYNGVQTQIGLLAKWRASLASSMALGAGRVGGQCLSMASGSNYSPRTWVTRDLPNNTTAFAFGFAFAIEGNATMGDLRANTCLAALCLGGDTTAQLALGVASDGSVYVMRPSAMESGTVVGASSGGKVLPYQWHYLQMEGLIDDTVGWASIAVDHATVLTVNNVDTKALAGVGADRFTFYNPLTQTFGANNMDVDDWYIKDSVGLLGECRVETLMPNADIAQGWGRSSGSANYPLVDEPQANTSDYVQASNVGDTDTYGYADLANSPVAIHSVMMSSTAFKTDVGVREIANQAKSGATTLDGPSFGLSTNSYAKNEHYMKVDPDTGVAWTTSGVNALQGGPKVVT